MRLHVFNPEHELAMAVNLNNFTSPRKVRELRKQLGFLPALWAEETDVVLVDDIQSAKDAIADLPTLINSKISNVQFVNHSQLHDINITEIYPWGWDKAIKHELIRYGLSAALCPNDEKIFDIRMLSHRKFAADTLPLLKCNGTLGESYPCINLNEIHQLITKYKSVLLKAPWSCSGRGIRHVDSLNIDTNLYGWIKNMLKLQGCLIVEPYYKKIMDLGMEFVSNAEGGITYQGLSLFHTENGVYYGNLIASEQTKYSFINNYIPVCLLQNIKEKIQIVFSKALRGKYKGPFGIDMMIVEDDINNNYYLHPCVEINLRRTMGHVALTLSPDCDDMRMRIMTSNNYKLTIK